MGIPKSSLTAITGLMHRNKQYSYSITSSGRSSSVAGTVRPIAFAVTGRLLHWEV